MPPIAPLTPASYVNGVAPTSMPRAVPALKLALATKVAMFAPVHGVADVVPTDRVPVLTITFPATLNPGSVFGRGAGGVCRIAQRCGAARRGFNGGPTHPRPVLRVIAPPPCHCRGIPRRKKPGRPPAEDGAGSI